MKHLNEEVYRDSDDGFEQFRRDYFGSEDRELFERIFRRNAKNRNIILRSVLNRDIKYLRTNSRVNSLLRHFIQSNLKEDLKREIHGKFLLLLS